MATTVDLTNLSDLDVTRILAEGVYTEFEQLATARALVSSSKPAIGASAQFLTTISGAAISTTALNWSADTITASSLSDTQITLQWREYAQRYPVNMASSAGSPTSLLAEALKATAAEVGKFYNALALATATVGSQVQYVTGSSRAGLGSSNTLTASVVRKARATLEKNNVQPMFGGNYVALVHPDVMEDLIAESSNNGFLLGAGNTNSVLWQSMDLNGQVAGGIFWVRCSNSALIASGAGSGGIDVYFTLLCGQRGLVETFSPVEVAEGFSEFPARPDRSIVLRATGPSTANLGITRDVGMVARLGFAILDEKAIVRIESAG